MPQDLRLTLNDAQWARLLDALDDWRHAEKAYGDEAAKYAGVRWIDDGPPRRDNWPQRVTPEAWGPLKQRRLAADEARAAYYELAASLGESPPRTRRPPIA
jgi:hypothetical protein